jgi:hypothetical protein
MNTIACDHCKKAKCRCFEVVGSSQCGRCAVKGLSCRYLNARPAGMPSKDPRDNAARLKRYREKIKEKRAMNPPSVRLVAQVAQIDIDPLVQQRDELLDEVQALEAEKERLQQEVEDAAAAKRRLLNSRVDEVVMNLNCEILTLQKTKRALEKDVAHEQAVLDGERAAHNALRTQLETLQRQVVESQDQLESLVSHTYAAQNFSQQSVSLPCTPYILTSLYPPLPQSPPYSQQEEE